MKKLSAAAIQVTSVVGVACPLYITPYGMPRAASAIRSAVSHGLQSALGAISKSKNANGVPVSRRLPGVDPRQVVIEPVSRYVERRQRLDVADDDVGEHIPDLCDLRRRILRDLCLSPVAGVGAGV